MLTLRWASVPRLPEPGWMWLAIYGSAMLLALPAESISPMALSRTQLSLLLPALVHSTPYSLLVLLTLSAATALISFGQPATTPYRPATS